jgi:hypothetical protein
MLRWDLNLEKAHAVSPQAQDEPASGDRCRDFARRRGCCDISLVASKVPVTIALSSNGRKNLVRTKIYPNDPFGFMLMNLVGWSICTYALQAFLAS